MELHPRKVCIACACARVPAVCADDAREMLLAEQLVGEARARRGEYVTWALTIEQELEKRAEQ